MFRAEARSHTWHEVQSLISERSFTAKCQNQRRNEIGKSRRCRIISERGLDPYRCTSCPNRLTYLDPVPRRERGVNLQFGQTYCTAGKKPRVFKKKECKVYPPDWCPKKKWPCEFRIYTFKNIRSRCMHNMFHEDEVPSEFRCAVRQEGVVELSPMAFFSGLEDSTAAQLLGVAVNSGEIVEMDDGLKHYCFYLELGGARYLPYWDGRQSQAKRVSAGFRG